LASTAISISSPIRKRKSSQFFAFRRVAPPESRHSSNRAAAPFGKWNESIQLTFENIGAAFSSEFSLDYDDLPFYPRVKERFSTIPNCLFIPFA